MPDSLDVIVIGAGPAGYVAAIRCAQLGLRTACIDERVDASGAPSLGGTCLNVGCIPSKALLDSSHQFAHLNHFAAHGISVDNAKVDVAAMLARKNKIVGKLTGGIAMLFKAHKIEFICGRAQLIASGVVNVNANVNDGQNGNGEKTSGKPRELRAKHIILAPGSVPVELPIARFDNQSGNTLIGDSSDALAFESVPPRLGIIGGGVIGLELGSVWNRLGAKVVIVEAMDELLATADRQIAREASRQFKKQGLDIRLGAKVEKVQAGKTVKLQYADESKSGGAQTLEVDRLIVAVGRRAATDNLLAEGCGVKVDARGLIEVDDHCRTALENVWAVGDAVRGPMLAHKGAEEGVAVAERIAANDAQVGHVDFNHVPWVIYTAPEIAWVGATEQQLTADNIPHRSGAFPFAATGRALAMEEAAGLVKIIAHAKTDEILGAHIIGAQASELIGECVLAMTYRASAEDLARTIHAHPTLSEAVHEAALAVDKRAIHKVG